jgi:pectate lyase
MPKTYPIHKLTFLLLFNLITFITKSQTPPAFPGAEGFGAHAKGGRGGQVIYVTNLNPNGPGSLTEALATPGKRYILFKVSGIIHNAAEVIYGDFTLAGQTSPGGITVRGLIVDEVYDTAGTGDNIIIRHIRSRPGNPVVNPGPGYLLDDACRMDGASNVIIDHCSFANAMDECVQISETSKLTIQNCSFAETLGDHYYLGGMLFNYSSPEHPQDSISIHHNVWNRLGGRMPEFSCESPYGSARPLNIELSDNLFWDQQINTWYNSNIDPSAPNPIDSFFVKMNLINNYSMVRSAYPMGMFAHNFLEIQSNSMHTSGNKMNIYSSYSDYDLFYCCNDFDLTGNNPNTDLGTVTKKSSPHPFPSISHTPTASVTNYIYNSAGAFSRDSMDRRLMSFIGKGIIDSHPVDSVDYYHDAYLLDFNPSNPPPAPLDTDNDGMPDYWETAHGLNPMAQDHNGNTLSVSITGISGYTNLECYLNCLSDFLTTSQNTGGCGIVMQGDNNIENKKINISLRPNPITNTSILDVSIDQKETLAFELYDITGRKAKEISGIHNGQNIISKEGLLPGIYIYRLIGAKGIVGMGKIVIE